MHDHTADLSWTRPDWLPSLQLVRWPLLDDLHASHAAVVSAFVESETRESFVSLATEAKCIAEELIANWSQVDVGIQEARVRVGVARRAASGLKSGQDPAPPVTVAEVAARAKEAEAGREEAEGTYLLKNRQFGEDTKALRRFFNNNLAGNPRQRTPRVLVEIEEALAEPRDHNPRRR